MAITFNPNTGVVVDDGATVRSNVANLWKQAFKINDTTPELNTEPETPAGQLIDGMTALILQKDSDILYLSNMFNPETAVGVFQDALAKIYFLQRHVAQATTVICTCKGLQGTQIPAGSIVEDTNGNQLTNAELAQIGANGTVDVLFSCVETGAIPISENTVNKIVSVIPGWDSVNNSAAGVLGRDRETQTEFEQRRYDSVAKNSHGLAESVSGTIGNLDDVIACRIEQNRSGETITTMGVQIPGHSVYLSVYGGDTAEIGAILHNKLDAGCGTAGNTSVQVTDPTTGVLCTYYFTIPTLQDMYIQITVDDTNANYDENAIKQAIINNFSGQTNEFTRVIMGDTVYASRFYQTVINAGLNNLVQIQISRTSGNWNTSVDFNLNEMPVLSENNITFVEG